MKTLFIVALCFISYIASAHINPQPQQAKQDSLIIDFKDGFDSTEVVILVDGDVEYVKTISTDSKLGVAASHTIKSNHLDKVIIQIDNQQVLLPKNPPPFIGVRLGKNHEILLQFNKTEFTYK